MAILITEAINLRLDAISKWKPLQLLLYSNKTAALLVLLVNIKLKVKRSLPAKNK